MPASHEIDIVDSHTEGEPTRVVIGGWPEPLGTTMAERRDAMRRTQDALRSGVVREPRGHDAIVGALLTGPVSTNAVAGVVFFNDVGYLGMCGHGLIGVVRTLEFLGRIGPGSLRIDTPVGQVGATLEADGSVTVTNVPSYLHAAGVEVNVPGIGIVQGDIAYGGNWFFLTQLSDLPLEMARIPELLSVTTAIREALESAGITGAGGARIDHIELFGPPTRSDADSRNFVLCPGSAYDRSPCGTGTSAKLAVLHARGDLVVGDRWRQESITGSLFTGWLSDENAVLVPHISGSAFITGRATLFFDERDPFRFGIST
jgi:4-hydroxyproline epimerase